MADFSVEEVKRYYERNTTAFLTLGQGAELGAIHRAVWGPGVTARSNALCYVEQQIGLRLDDLEPRPGKPLHVLDLGCGVCMSLCRMAAARPIRGTGITLSHSQVEQARRRIAAAGLEGRVVCLLGDFMQLPPAAADADAAFAIESFVHVTDPGRFFRECARAIRPGGLLMVCDDTLAESAATSDAAQHWIETFRRGWHVNTLLEPEAIEQLAADAGFHPRESIDLTPYLELGRPRDLALAALMHSVGRLPGWPLGGRRWASLRGGHALQRCLRKGWLQHRLMIWSRSADS